jgi:aspartate--ammonia ligase
MTEPTNDLQRIIIPDNYKAHLTLRETEVAIKNLKDYFEKTLSERLNLTRVSAPLFVKPETGLNDNLNGVEGPVSFKARDVGDSTIEIVHSLAKWKRWSLYRYGFNAGEGLYTDMNAIRKDEDLSNIHSIYVDQWDWEKVISREQRTKDTLRQVVETIYSTFKSTEEHIVGQYPQLGKLLPENIHFVTTQELEDQYPELSPKDREHAICKKHGAVFVMEIGGALKSGHKHDGRAPDYDDWQLNGDILFWYPILDRSLELSSMGIRVDSQSLQSQLKICGCEDRLGMSYHKALLDETLPFTIGGGIGQSRICMYFMRKAHIGEVQASLWDPVTLDVCAKAGVELL